MTPSRRRTGKRDVRGTRRSRKRGVRNTRRSRGGRSRPSRSKDVRQSRRYRGDDAFLEFLQQFVNSIETENNFQIPVFLVFTKLGIPEGGLMVLWKIALESQEGTQNMTRLSEDTAEFEQLAKQIIRLMSVLIDPTRGQPSDSDETPNYLVQHFVHHLQIAQPMKREMVGIPINVWVQKTQRSEINWSIVVGDTSIMKDVSSETNVAKDITRNLSRLIVPDDADASMQVDADDTPPELPFALRTNLRNALLNAAASEKVTINVPFNITVSKTWVEQDKRLPPHYVVNWHIAYHGIKGTDHEHIFFNQENFNGIIIGFLQYLQEICSRAITTPLHGHTGTFSFPVEQPLVLRENIANRLSHAPVSQEFSIEVPLSIVGENTKPNENIERIDEALKQLWEICQRAIEAINNGR